MTLKDLQNEIKNKLYPGEGWYSDEDILLDKQAIQLFKTDEIDTTLRNYEKSLLRIGEEFIHTHYRLHESISQIEAKSLLVNALRYQSHFSEYSNERITLEEAEKYAEEIFNAMGDNAQIFIGNSIFGATYETTLTFITNETIGLVSISDSD
jgi:cell division GTPase FtsZ